MINERSAVAGGHCPIFLSYFVMSRAPIKAKHIVPCEGRSAKRSLGLTLGNLTVSQYVPTDFALVPRFLLLVAKFLPLFCPRPIVVPVGQIVRWLIISNLGVCPPHSSGPQLTRDWSLVSFVLPIHSPYDSFWSQIWFPSSPVPPLFPIFHLKSLSIKVTCPFAPPLVSRAPR